MYFRIGYFSLLFVLVLSMSGCSKKYKLEYGFDSYALSLQTYEIFDNQNISDIDRSQGIQMIAKQRNQTGYIDSLIISDIDLSEIALDKFMTLNKKTLESRFMGYEQSKYSSLSFKCKWKEMTGNLLNFNVMLQNKKIYFSQYIFSKAKSWYMISLSSEDNKQIKLFKKSIKNISCN